LPELHIDDDPVLPVGKTLLALTWSTDVLRTGRLVQVDFVFDTVNDTAEEVAAEMVTDLDITQDQALQAAEFIRTAVQHHNLQAIQQAEEALAPVSKVGGARAQLHASPSGPAPSGEQPASGSASIDSCEI
jgi:hypothetical protein